MGCGSNANQPDGIRDHIRLGLGRIEEGCESWPVRSGGIRLWFLHAEGSSFSKAVRKRYGIEYLPVAACVVNTRIIGHADGRNDSTIAELKKHFGSGVVTDAGEGQKISGGL